MRCEVPFLDCQQQDEVRDRRGERARLCLGKNRKRATSMKREKRQRGDQRGTERETGNGQQLPSDRTECRFIRRFID
jgi:hypothetical protein